ncbi:phage shock envelope stress response protein PspM [Nakamurella deserti]|uniref:phage shock envelope stress response protein PspM n=1 Tax=Nakamurella deserti TaxID=2164074 RepID=UPI000DBE6232
MRKAVVRGAMAKAVTAGRSEVVQQATSAAGEMLRVRRDPSVAAARRVRSAQRRVSLWGAGAVVPAGALGVQFMSSAGAFASQEVLRTMLYVAILLVAVVGMVRAAADLRDRKKAVRALPPPQPTRTVVTTRIRPQLAELSRYSDGLRKLAGLTGLDPSSELARELRDDIITAADSAEKALRARAAELTDLEHAAVTAPADARPGLRVLADQLASEVTAGVAEYGNYVTAVSEIVVAGRTMRVDGNELADGADKLRWLAVGMRELAG